MHPKNHRYKKHYQTKVTEHLKFKNIVACCGKLPIELIPDQWNFVNQLNIEDEHYLACSLPNSI